MTWQHYLTVDDPTPRYVELCEDIALRFNELAMLLAEEKRARAQGWRDSEATSVSGREWDATLCAEAISSDVVKLKAELEAVKEERDLLRWILDART